MPYARFEDPSTSHQAAKSVKNITETQASILKILAEPMTDERLIEIFQGLAEYDMAPKASESGIRSRRADLVKIGLVEDTGIRAKIKTGRSAIVWSVSHG